MSDEIKTGEEEVVATPAVEVASESTNEDTAEEEVATPVEAAE